MRLPRTPGRPDPVSTVRLVLEHPELLHPEVKGQYLHWEELRHRAAPEGCTHEQWWAAISLARTGIRRNLPLHDSKGKAFGFAMTDTAQRAVHEIDRDASGQISLPEDVVTEGNRDHYIVSSLIEEAFRSSQLEGASTTRRVAKEMVSTGRDPRNQSERMIFNNFRAMEWSSSHKDAPLTPAAVLELHRLVTLDTLEDPDAAGRLRRHDEPVHVFDSADGEVLHVPPAANELPTRMEALCAFANGTDEDSPFVHPVVRAILLHFWLAYEHPFVDGNGRVARALFYWSMLRQGYWLTEFLSISRVISKARAQYDRAFLYSESSESDATYFVVHQLGVIRTAITDLHSYLRRKSGELHSVEQALRTRGDLNPRQVTVIGEALRHPDTHFMIEGHQRMHRVSYQTARTDLLGLTTLGYLEQHKAGRRLYFVPTPEIRKKLKPSR